MKHLTPQQVVALLDGTPDAASRAHLASCDPCRANVSQLHAVTSAAAMNAEVPDPSPLFWDHLSARVRQSVADEPAPRQWTSAFWRPMMAVAMAAACIALVIFVRISDVQPTQLAQVASPVAAESDALDPSAMLVAQVAAGASWQDLRRAASPTTDGAEAAMASLTPEERAAFVRLLKSSPDGEH